MNVFFSHHENILYAGLRRSARGFMNLKKIYLALRLSSEDAHVPYVIHSLKVQFVFVNCLKYGILVEDKVIAISSKVKRAVTDILKIYQISLHIEHP